jgi:hypothetical protein
MKPIRFSLRDLLWLVVVIALVCGWWVEHRRAQAAQQRAAAWRTSAENGAGHLKLYRGLYVAVERSGYSVVWDMHGVPQRLMPIVQPVKPLIEVVDAPESPAADSPDRDASSP